MDIAPLRIAEGDSEPSDPSWFAPGVLL